MLAINLITPPRDCFGIVVPRNDKSGSVTASPLLLSLQAKRGNPIAQIPNPKIQKL